MEANDHEPGELETLLQTARPSPTGPIIALTGAGISAESGIPTFRGREGYWRVGSRNYHPQELATRSAFSAMPEQVWSWYLMRLRTCLAAEPNPAHRALVDLDRHLGSDFLLITQNVDGLHPRAGSPRERTYEIHGNIAWMRCSADCRGRLDPVPRELLDANASELRTALRCAECGAWMRPHVLWFDEVYDEARYRWESSLSAAARAELLLIVGTTGSTNLPLQVAAIAAERGAAVVVVNPEPSVFSELAERTDRGIFLRGTAGHWVPRVAAALTES